MHAHVRGEVPVLSDMYSFMARIGCYYLEGGVMAVGDEDVNIVNANSSSLGGCGPRGNRLSNTLGNQDVSHDGQV
jgi:hypothetical protein